MSVLDNRSRLSGITDMKRPFIRLHQPVRDLPDQGNQGVNCLVRFLSAHGLGNRCSACASFMMGRMNRRWLFWRRSGRLFRGANWRDTRDRLRRWFCRRLGYLGLNHGPSIIAQSGIAHAGYRSGITGLTVIYLASLNLVRSHTS